MKALQNHTFARPAILRSGLTLTLLLSSAAFAPVALSDDEGSFFSPGNLLVSRAIYDIKNPPTIVPGTTVLPPNCTLAPNCVNATTTGVYPQVFNNALVDGSFGVTSKIVLDQTDTLGFLINSIEVPNSSQRGIFPNSDQTVTSFSSKSELALNLSTDKRS